MARKAVLLLPLITLICLLLSTPAFADYKINYIHTDHRGAPVAITDQSQTVIWRASYKPFGEAVLQEDPDGDGVNTVMNIRYPGQYYDEETGTYYNYYRDYDPGLGRYIQSDPIGVRKDFSDPQFQIAMSMVKGISNNKLYGLNSLYNYGQGNPLIYSDPYGLAPDWVGPAGVVLGATGGALFNTPWGKTPYGLGCSIALVAVGGGLTAWDYATTPTEVPASVIGNALEAGSTIDKIQDKIDQMNNN